MSLIMRKFQNDPEILTYLTPPYGVMPGTTDEPLASYIPTTEAWVGKFQRHFPMHQLAEWWLTTRISAAGCWNF